MTSIFWLRRQELYLRLTSVLPLAYNWNRLWLSLLFRSQSVFLILTGPWPLGYNLPSRRPEYAQLLRRQSLVQVYCISQFQYRTLGQTPFWFRVLWVESFLSFVITPGLIARVMFKHKPFSVIPEISALRNSWFGRVIAIISSFPSMFFLFTGYEPSVRTFVTPSTFTQG